jgi:hypothetical protein
MGISLQAASGGTRPTTFQGIVAQMILLHLVAQLHLGHDTFFQTLAHQTEEQGFLPGIRGAGRKYPVARSHQTVRGAHGGSSAVVETAGKYPLAGNRSANRFSTAGACAWWYAASGSPRSGDQNRSTRFQKNLLIQGSRSQERLPFVLPEHRNIIVVHDVDIEFVVALRVAP